MPPAGNEAGWKDTVQSLPGQVTRIVVRYAPQSTLVGAPDPHYLFDPDAGGHGYVWHCHIIDHEDNEMMRPLLVLPRPGATRTYIQGVDY
jgi:FtsP/CotA-like multicopper oxidase with cupredoxin domain